jgi:hypothetical protein
MSPRCCAIGELRHRAHGRRRAVVSPARTGGEQKDAAALLCRRGAVVESRRPRCRRRATTDSRRTQPRCCTVGGLRQRAHGRHRAGAVVPPASRREGVTGTGISSSGTELAAPRRHVHPPFLLVSNLYLPPAANQSVAKLQGAPKARLFYLICIFLSCCSALLSQFQLCSYTAALLELLLR